MFHPLTSQEHSSQRERIAVCSYVLNLTRTFITERGLQCVLMFYPLSSQECSSQRKDCSVSYVLSINLTRTFITERGLQCVLCSKPHKNIHHRERIVVCSYVLNLTRTFITEKGLQCVSMFYPLSSQECSSQREDCSVFYVLSINLTRTFITERGLQCVPCSKPHKNIHHRERIAVCSMF